MRMRISRLYQNPKTKEFLLNEEVYCGRCFTNFEDEYAHQIHRTKAGRADSICLDPESVDLEAYVNFGDALVWKCKD
ncbi:unannotated protein [freshwater metagenome]|uniref:Unannotated protein n=1 Tax=freshwater metagenome TaxID=449393 RepID=A0A6J6ST44_9ZZZZ